MSAVRMLCTSGERSADICTLPVNDGAVEDAAFPSEEVVVAFEAVPTAKGNRCIRCAATPSPATTMTMRIMAPIFHCCVIALLYPQRVRIQIALLRTIRPRNERVIPVRCRGRTCLEVAFEIRDVVIDGAAADFRDGEEEAVGGGASGGYCNVGRFGKVGTEQKCPFLHSRADIALEQKSVAESAECPAADEFR